MKKLLSLKIILVFICMTSFAHARPIVHVYGNSIAKAIGYSLSHQNYKKINGVKVKTQNIVDELKANALDKGFKLKSVSVYKVIKNKKIINVAGSITHMDKKSNFVETKFDAVCNLKKKRLITIDNIKLKIITRPKAISFLVPDGAIALKNLRTMTFKAAMEQVRAVSKEIGNFDTEMDLEPQKYVFISFILGKINKTDKIIPVMSDFPYSDKGSRGKLIRTKDKGIIAFVKTKFAYNNLQPEYFTVLWKTDKKFIPICSYSTHGLVKEIQTALSLKGYDVGTKDGKLNKKTKDAIAKYVKAQKFHLSTKISIALLWFMQQESSFDIPKIVQATLLNMGEQIGVVDGKIGAKTRKGIKKYQRSLGVKPDGKITPELVYLLLYTSKNIDTLHAMDTIFIKPIFLKTYQDKKWPNQV